MEITDLNKEGRIAAMLMLPELIFLGIDFVLYPSTLFPQSFLWMRTFFVYAFAAVLVSGGIMSIVWMHFHKVAS